MSFMNKIKSAVSKNADKAPGMIDKAAGMARKKAGTKHAGKVDSAAQKAKEFVAKTAKDGGSPTDRQSPPNTEFPPTPGA